MSFFYDFLNYFDIEDLKNEVSISLVVGTGLMIVGNVKILNFSSDKITVLANKKEIVFEGKELVISAMGKGEIVIAGKILNIKIGEWYARFDLCKN